MISGLLRNKKSNLKIISIFVLVNKKVFWKYKVNLSLS